MKPDQAVLDGWVRKVWQYHLLGHSLQPSDVILVLGSHDPRVAARGAEIFLEGWAPRLAFSGGVGRLTRRLYDTTEAEAFAQIALEMGVPEEVVLVENLSTNSGENFVFSRRLMAQHGLTPRRLILVHKPYMERRAYATCKKVWPEPEIVVTSPAIPYEEYPTPEIDKTEMINIVVGDLQRIKVYAERGFQIPQAIPDDVWAAYEQLVRFGFDKYVIG